MIAGPSSPSAGRTVVRDASVGVGVMLGARGLILAFQLIVLAVLARRLGPSAFGTVQLAVAVFTYVGFATDLGLATVATRNAASGAIETLEGDLTGVRLVLGAAALAVVFLVLAVAPIPPDERALVIVLAIGTASGVVNFRWLAQGRERFRRLATIDVVAAALQLGAAVLLVRDPGDLAAAGLVFILPALVSTILLLFQPDVRTLIRPRVRHSGRRLLLVAIPLGASAIAIQLYNNADSILLGVFRSVDEVGWYGAAYRVVNASLAVPLAAYAVILPMLARLLAQDAAEVARLLTLSSRALLAFALPCAFGLTLTAGVVTTTLFGPAFAPAATPLAILAWVCVTVSSNAPFGALMLARGRDRAYLKVTGTGSALNVLANLLVIPHFGMTGAAVVTVTQEVLVLAGLCWYTRDLSIPILRRSIGRPLVAALVMSAVVFPIRDSIVAIPIGVATFGVAGLVTGAIPWPGPGIRALRSRGSSRDR